MSVRIVFLHLVPPFIWSVKLHEHPTAVRAARKSVVRMFDWSVIALSVFHVNDALPRFGVSGMCVCIANLAYRAAPRTICPVTKSRIVAHFFFLKDAASLQSAKWLLRTNRRTRRRLPGGTTSPRSSSGTTDIGHFLPLTLIHHSTGAPHPRQTPSLSNSQPAVSKPSFVSGTGMANLPMRFLVIPGRVPRQCRKR